jgi:hypothetical protein
MKYFVLSNNTITAVISSDLNLEQGSSKFIPTTKQTLTTYNNWLASNPSQQPTIADIFSSTSNPSSKASVITGASNAIQTPAAKSNRAALTKQFQQFINKR